MKVISRNSIVEIWVPHNTDESLVQAVYEKYRKSCKVVVVYRSGKSDLVTETRALITANI